MRMYFCASLCVCTFPLIDGWIFKKALSVIHCAFIILKVEMLIIDFTMASFFYTIRLFYNAFRIFMSDYATQSPEKLNRSCQSLHNMFGSCF